MPFYWIDNIEKFHPSTRKDDDPLRWHVEAIFNWIEGSLEDQEERAANYQQLAQFRAELLDIRSHVESIQAILGQPKMPL